MTQQEELDSDIKRFTEFMDNTKVVRDESVKLISNLVQSAIRPSTAELAVETAGTSEEKQAKKELEKSHAAADANAKTVERVAKVQQIAKKFLDNHIDGMIDKAILETLNGDLEEEETVKRCRAIVRGYLTSKSEMNADIVKARNDISNALLEGIKSQIAAFSGMDKSEINAKLNKFNELASKLDKEEQRISKQLDSFLEQTNGWTDDNSLAAIDPFIESLDKLVEKGGKSVIGRIDDAINNIPIMKQVGIEINTSTVLGPTINNIQNNICGGLETKMKPYLQENVKKITETVTYVNKRITEFKEAEDYVRNQIKDAEEEAKKYAEEALQKFAGEIMSKVNIDISGITGGLGNAVSGFKLGF